MALDTRPGVLLVRLVVVVGLGLLKEYINPGIRPRLCFHQSQSLIQRQE